jgi:hypothetical protein
MMLHPLPLTRICCAETCLTGDLLRLSWVGEFFLQLKMGSARGGRSGTNEVEIIVADMTV